MLTIEAIKINKRAIICKFCDSVVSVSLMQYTKKVIYIYSLIERKQVDRIEKE